MSFLVFAYAMSPIDLIPDFIPILGYLDDIIILPLSIYLIIKLLPKDLLVEYEKLAADDENIVFQKNWIVGILIILLWLMLFSYLFYKFFAKSKIL